MSDKKMSSKQIWTIILISLVVAVISSLITVSFTGNTIRVPTATTIGQTDIYTKQEIDAKLGNVATNQGIFNALNKCVSLETGNEGIQAGQSCNSLCRDQQGKTCVATLLYRNNKSPDKAYLGGSCDTVWTAMYPIKDAFLDCVCC
ncbi:MAG: hypothetical protein AABY05_03255 [Nanoarchaeota archaeon]